MVNIKNISLSAIRDFLIKEGFKYSHDKGGHEIWKKTGLTRPVCLQSHIDPVPVHIVKQICRHLGITSKQMCEKIEALKA